MSRLDPLYKKDEKLVVGLMSGTSLDAIDAALVRIKGYDKDTKVELINFISLEYKKDFKGFLKNAINEGSTKDLCLLNFYLGHLFSQAALLVSKGYQVDLVGSHGHTFFHQPQKIKFFDYEITSTLQLTESSLIQKALNCPVISDFRVKDMAYDGQGAPLVPFVDSLLYREKDKVVGLQNIGGISNISILPNNSDEVIAFDQGPGNMVIDELMRRLFNKEFDSDGKIALKGKINTSLLNFLKKDPYLKRKAPKTTGREDYGQGYVNKLLNYAKDIPSPDIIATTTYFTSFCITDAIKDFIKVDKLILSGGGSHNKAIIKFLKPHFKEVVTFEEIGGNSDAKEAICFAILANQCIMGLNNNLKSVTGATKDLVLGKITI